MPANWRAPPRRSFRRVSHPHSVWKPPRCNSLSRRRTIVLATMGRRADSQRDAAGKNFYMIKYISRTESKVYATGSYEIITFVFYYRTIVDIWMAHRWSCSLHFFCRALPRQRRGCLTQPSERATSTSFRLSSSRGPPVGDGRGAKGLLWPNTLFTGRLSETDITAVVELPVKIIEGRQHVAPAWTSTTRPSTEPAKG